MAQYNKSIIDVEKQIKNIMQWYVVNDLSKMINMLK